MARALVVSLLLTVSLFAQRVTPERTLSGPVAGSSARSLPAAVWTGKFFAIFWNDDAGLFSGVVGVDGKLLGPSVRLADNKELVGGVAFSGEELLLVTTLLPDGKVIARRLTSSLVPIGDPAILGDGLMPGATWNGSEFFVHWNTRIGSGALIVAKVEAGVVTASRVINTTPKARPDSASLAATPFELLLVWEDAVGCETPTGYPCVVNLRLRAVRLDPQLNQLDSQSIDITEDGYFPSVVTNGQEYFLAWSDLLSVHAQRIHPSGALLGNDVSVDPLEGGTNLGASAAWDGRQYFVVTQDFASAHAGVYGTVIDASGAIVPPAVIPIHLEMNFYEGPVTFAGPPSRFLVAYRRYNERREFRTFIRVVDLSGPARRRAAAH